MNYQKLKNKFFVIAGPNVIESETQIMDTAEKLKEIFNKSVCLHRNAGI